RLGTARVSHDACEGGAAQREGREEENLHVSPYAGGRRLVWTTIAAPVALLDRAIVRLLPAVPKPVVQRLSSRYIAGPTLDDAIRAVRGLNAQGKMATVDVLGEDVTSPREARAIAQEYLDVFEEI